MEYQHVSDNEDGEQLQNAALNVILHAYDEVFNKNDGLQSELRRRSWADEVESEEEDAISHVSATQSQTHDEEVPATPTAVNVENHSPVNRSKEEGTSAAISSDRRSANSISHNAKKSSGLLDALLHESQTLGCAKNQSPEKSSSSCVVTPGDMVDSSALNLCEREWEYGDPNSPLGRSAACIFNDHTPLSGSSFGEHPAPRAPMIVRLSKNLLSMQVLQMKGHYQLDELFNVQMLYLMETGLDRVLNAARANQS